MKKINIMIIGLLFAVTVMASTVEASEYIGEYCWNVTPQGTTVTGLLRMGVFHFAAEHYMMSGTLTAGAAIIPYRGNMELINGSYVGSLINAGISQAVIFNQNAAFQLNTSFNGTYKGISNFYDTSANQVASTVDQGTFTKVICP